MFYILTALSSEARPLIDFYKLKKIEDKPFFIFANEEQNILLIVSGIGEEKALISTTYLLTKYKTDKDSFLLNIGIAGGSQNLEIGDIFLINKLTDLENQKSFFPDMNFKFDLKESSIFSVKTPQIGEIKNISENNYLVDMESVGVFKASNYFLDTSSLIFIKIISDNLKSNQISQINNKKIEELISKHVHKIDEVISTLKKVEPSQKYKNSDVNQIVTQITEFLKLTKSQEKILFDRIMFYKLKNSKIIDFETLNQTIFYKYNLNNLHKKLKNSILEEVINLHLI